MTQRQYQPQLFDHLAPDKQLELRRILNLLQLYVKSSSLSPAEMQLLAQIKETMHEYEPGTNGQGSA